MSDKTIKLTKPVKYFGEEISEITLKEPTGAQFLKLGQPQIPIYNQSGAAYLIPQNETVSAYLDTLIYKGDENISIVVAQLSLVDMMTLQNELFDFFSSAAAMAAARKEAKRAA